MRNESSIKDNAPAPPPCPSCSQIMRLARTTSRFGDLPDIYTYECRVCRVSYIKEGITTLCAPSLYYTILLSAIE
jgi:hypothetical protein